MGIVLFIVMVVSLGFIFGAILHRFDKSDTSENHLGNLLILDDPVDGERYMSLEVYSKAGLDALKDGDKVTLKVIFPSAKNTSSVMDN